MNKVYKHIWSKALGCVIVVPECAKGGGGKNSSRKRKLAASLMASTLLSGVAWADDLPTGGQIVAGQGTITTNGSAMTINQSTDRMIANWQSFSIGAGNSVTFNQPSVSSVALNRVVGQDPSRIQGNLNANGQVFLLNPNGIAIGKTGSVRTGGFVASTLDISNQDFLAGNYQFNGVGGAITNDGDLNGNVVALIAPSVTNNGTITGDTALAAGTDVLLDFDGDGLLSIEVKANTLAGLVENNGLIQADGGTAILTARGASQALAGVVNNTGTVEAKTIARKGGRILLLGDMENGAANVSGELKADFVETSAAEVTLDKDLRVETDGGQWLIDPVDITIDASKASAIETALGSGSVMVTTANGVTWAGTTNGTGTDEGNITVAAPVTWGNYSLILRADNDITINAALNASSTAGLELQYGQANAAAGNTATYAVNAPVNLASTGSFSTKLGSDGGTITYTILTSLGAAGSTTGTDLQGINGNLSGNYVLGADIDASDTATANWPGGFTPIVSHPSTGFSGTFDGLGHVISNLNIYRPNDYSVGLIGYATNATIRNVGLVGGHVTGGTYVGGLVGQSSNTDITNVYNTGAVSGYSSVGGLVGYNHSNSSITDAYTTSVINGGGSSSGGLVGTNAGSSISNAFATGAVIGAVDGYGKSGHLKSGGLVGWNSGGSITNSYATGSVSGHGAVGGLVGENTGGSAIHNSYATGAVTFWWTAGSELTGYTDKTSTVTGSFYKSNNVTNLQNGAVSPSPWATGLTTSQLQDPFTFIDAGWDFATLWGKSSAGENNGTMMLRNVGPGTFYDDYARLSGNITKTYGDANPALTGITLDGVGTGNVSLAWNSSMTNTTNAGTYAYSGGNVVDVTTTSPNGVYVDYGAGKLTVNKAALTVTANDASKTYDGLAFSGGNGVTYSGFVNGEDFSVLSGSLTYGGTAQGARNAGSYGLTTSGLASGNYDISYADGTLTVSKAALTLSAADITKTYDGGLSANGVALITAGTLFGGDTLSGGNFAFTDRNAGTGKTVTISSVSVNDGNNGGNYALTYTDNTNSTILQKTISAITGITANNKTYDGTVSATLSASGAGFTGMVAGDALTIATSTGAFADKNAANGKTVNITGLSLGGTDAGNYILADNTAIATADIAKARVSAITGIGALDKFLDGTVDATLDLSGAAFNGMVAGDILTIATATGVFSDAWPGIGKTVAISNLSLGGADAGNYTLIETTAVATADIFTRPALSVLPWQMFEVGQPPQASAPEINLDDTTISLPGDGPFTLVCESGQCAIEEVAQ